MKFKIKINLLSILSILSLLVGVLFYIYWGTYYGVWADIGIYSFTIVFVLAGIFGLLIAFYEKKEE